MSGSVFVENVSSLANVALDSSRNVGKIWNVSASASFSFCVAREDVATSW